MMLLRDPRKYQIKNCPVCKQHQTMEWLYDYDLDHPDHPPQYAILCLYYRHGCNTRTNFYTDPQDAVYDWNNRINLHETPQPNRNAL